MFTGELLTKPCKEIDRAWTGTCADTHLSKYSSWEGRRLCVTQLFSHAICITVKPILALLAALNMIAVSPIYLIARCCNYDPTGQFAKVLGNLLGSAIVSPWTQTILAIRAFAGIFHPKCYFRTYDEARMRNAILERDYNFGGNILLGAPQELQANQELIDLALDKSPNSFQYVNPTLRSDKVFVLKTLKRDGNLLKFVSPELQNDPEVVLPAIKYSNGKALKYANPELKNDPVLVLEVIKSKPSWPFYERFFKYVDPSLMQDRAFALDALEADEEFFHCLDTDFVDDAFKHEAVKRNGLVLRYLSTTEKGDETLALAAITNQPEAIRFVSSSLTGFNEFLVKAAKINGFIVLYFEFESLRSPMDMHDIYNEAVINMVQRLKLLSSSELVISLQEVRKNDPFLASSLESALGQYDRPMLNLDNIHFTFS